MSRVAGYYGNFTDSKNFGYRISEVMGAFNKQFFDASAKTYTDTNIDIQTGHPLALSVVALVEQGDIDAVVENLVQNIKDNDYHLNTGEKP